MSALWLLHVVVAMGWLALAVALCAALLGSAEVLATGASWSQMGRRIPALVADAAPVWSMGGAWYVHRRWEADGSLLAVASAGVGPARFVWSTLAAAGASAWLASVVAGGLAPPSEVAHQADAGRSWWTTPHGRFATDAGVLVAVERDGVGVGWSGASVVVPDEVGTALPRRGCAGGVVGGAALATGMTVALSFGRRRRTR